MFAVRFDSLKRKMIKQDPPVLLHAVETLQTGSPNFEGFMALYLDPDNATLDVCIEDDNRTYTFFTTFRDPHMIDLVANEERRKIDDRVSAED